MLGTEPINLREWKVPKGDSVVPGRLFTCGRPGRATHGREKVNVNDDIIDRWVNGLPSANPVHIVSLLGHKTTGLSEFSYYPFRSALEAGMKPTFEEWLNARYVRSFVVHEFPTTDSRGLPRQVVAAASARVLDCLRSGYTTIVIDSAGAERTARVCEALGATLPCS